MKPFLREVVTAMREGFHLFFVPVMAAIKAARTPNK